MWLPVTLNAPAPPDTVPAEVEPSPQVIVAAKSPAALAVSLSVKLATVTLLSAWPAVPLIVVACAVSVSASATATVPDADDAGLIGGAGDRHRQRFAAFVGIGVAAAHGEVAVGAADRAGRAGPSPQAIVAVKPEALSELVVSVKLAIVVLDPSATPSVAPVSCTVAARLPAPLPICAVLLAVAEAPPPSSVSVTVTASLPAPA